MKKRVGLSCVGLCLKVEVNENGGGVKEEGGSKIKASLFLKSYFLSLRLPEIYTYVYINLYIHASSIKSENTTLTSPF